MPHPATELIARAEVTDVPVLSTALAHAFQADPVFEWVVPDPAARQERLPAVFAAFVDLYLPYGATYVAGDGVGGALWAPVGSRPFPDDRLANFGEQMAAALGEHADRAFELDAILESHHPAEPASYLQFMGVVPGHQGHGLGSRLLRVVLDECDSTVTPCYLEATSPDNRRLYERHAFETIAEIGLPDGPTLWAMWRR